MPALIPEIKGSDGNTATEDKENVIMAGLSWQDILEYDLKWKLQGAGPRHTLTLGIRWV